MRLIFTMLVLGLAGCANFPTPPRIPADPVLLQTGLQLMQMGQPYTLPAPTPTQASCMVYPTNKITGVSQVMCY